jgi:hypothetical protein
MSQTMTLSEQPPSLVGHDAGAHARQIDRRSPSRCARVACNGFGDLFLAVGMVLLAPLVALLLAGAFALACWRMQWLDADEPKGSPAPTPDAARRSVPTVEGSEPRFRLNVHVQSSHLWN